MGVVLLKMLINSILARHYFEPFEVFSFAYSSTRDPYLRVSLLFIYFEDDMDITCQYIYTL